MPRLDTCHAARPALCAARTQACGSSGTALGIALGNRLAGLGLRVHAYCVCASPAFFYRHCDSLLAELGATPDVLGCCAEGLLRCPGWQDQGIGFRLWGGTYRG